ncbi:segregation/condensation protein A [Candidatus Woesearchaeota archaeon]|nr:segregation/condensation protein A [Candidatus Woesearchaeota archaeon]
MAEKKDVDNGIANNAEMLNKGDNLELLSYTEAPKLENKRITAEKEQGRIIITSQEGIFELLFDKDEISWQSIILELVRTNQMNPWDIDITLLSHKYLEIIQTLKELDFRISGKIVLAAALLLKIKSNRLVGEDLDYLDSLFAQSEGGDDLDYGADLTAQQIAQQFKLSPEEMKLLPRTPAMRNRKVSIYDLIEALQKAMEVKRRRVLRDLPAQAFVAPKKKKEISMMIYEVFARIKSYFLTNKNTKLTFTQLLPSDTKEDKVYTFIPLLHLSNARKIDINQEVPFGEIEIQLLTQQAHEKVGKELGEQAS